MPITFWNPERLVNTTTSGDQRTPSVTVLPDGGTVVVWLDQGPTPDVVRMQRFDVFGNPVGGETTIGNAISNGNPQVAVLPDGRYAVAWLTGTNELSLQRFQAGGALDGGVTVVTSTIDGSFQQPFDFIGLANNTYAVAYAAVTTSDDVFLRVISGNGSVGGEIAVDSGGTNQSAPYLSANPSSILVTWTEFGANAGDIQARRYSLTGGSPTAEVTVNATTTGLQYHSPAALLTTGNYVVVWRDDSTGFLRGAIVGSAGDRISTEFQVALDPSGADVVGVAATQQGGFVVVYRISGPSHSSLVAQAFNSFGIPDGARTLIADNISSGSPVDVAALADGRIAVTWAGTAAPDGSGLGIYTRILDPRDGVISGDPGANTLYGNNFRGDQISGLAGDDTLYGFGGDDVLFGGDGGDGMAGGEGHDALFGEFGNDTMIGEAGNDNIDGGAGTDAVLWSAARSNYFVRSFVSGGQVFTQVSAATGTDAVDTLVNIEVLGFSNGGQAFGLAGIQQNLVSNMDGSLYDDVLFQNSATGQIAFVNMTAGAAGGFTNVLGALPAGWRLVGSDDVSGDGRADALVQDTNTGSIYTVNIGSGAPVFTTISAALTSSYQAIASGDVTRDGTADVLVRDSATGQTFIADLNAGGSFGGWIAGPNLGTGWRTVGLGDFNRDGASDVLMQNIADGTTVYRDIANGQWGSVTGAVGAAWVAREAADIDGDGYCDVVFRNTSTSDIWWVDMLGGSNSGFNVIVNGLAGWDVRGSADVDNDGWRDVIVQNLADGTTYYADMNAGTFSGFGTVTGALGTQWLAVG
jgi:hypothetical protein